MQDLISSTSTAVPAGLAEVARLGRTLDKRADDILAYFDHPGTSNGAPEAINGRLEHLRGIALGFRNLTHYIARSRRLQTVPTPLIGKSRFRYVTDYAVCALDSIREDAGLSSLGCAVRNQLDLAAQELATDSTGRVM